MDNRADNLADILMVSGVSRSCPDCLDVRIFVPADDEHPDTAAYCCTDCGAAVLIDPGFEYDALASRVA
jgi:hypothetical protein